ncbi:unnamed protein product [Hymenolepis diminuta]|uniref:Ovule protein n=1 Tax=Hymenolepis diminuta TaxID=6216 RepID=A0A0R3SX42_HYMDI|nr:unnamed protein product [Hymenolepis diminuta]
MIDPHRAESSNEGQSINRETPDSETGSELARSAKFCNSVEINTLQKGFVHEEVMTEFISSISSFEVKRRQHTANASVREVLHLSHCRELSLKKEKEGKDV